jgi:hypothetical protein
MNTGVDRAAALAGYYPSLWPVECGGNRRQKAATGSLDARGGTTHVTTVCNGRRNVMMIRPAAALSPRRCMCRVATGSRVANGMFLTPGGARDIYYCSTLAISRVQWRSNRRTDAGC